MNPRRDTVLRYSDHRGHSGGVLAVLSNQVMLGGQLVAIYPGADEAALLGDALLPRPERVVFVDFHDADRARYKRVGRLPGAAARVLGQFLPGVPAIRTKILLEPIDQVGRGSGRYRFDARWTTASIMARVESGELSLVPVFSDLTEVSDPGANGTEESRSMQAEQRRMVAGGRYYFAVTPHDEPFKMLEVLPAARAEELSGIHELAHQSIGADLLWDL